MNPATQYFADNLQAYPVDVLVDGLRRAGYDDLTISQAWLEITQAQAAAVAVDGGSSRPHQWASVAAATTAQPVASTAPGPLQAARSSRTSFLIVGALVLVVAAIGSAFFLTQDDRTSDRAIAKEVAKQTNLDEDTVAAALDGMGGATVKGDLPDGWVQARDGAWGDRTTGNNVTVLVQDAPEDVTLEQAFARNREAIDTTAAFSGVKDAGRGRMLGQASRRLTGRVGGNEIRQDYVLGGGKFAIVTVTIFPGSDEAERQDAYGVADALRPTG